MSTNQLYGATVKSVPTAESGLTLNPLLSDRAVFQSGKPLPVWGKAAPKSLVKCEFNGRTVFTSARPDGMFKVYFPAMDCAENLTLKVSDGTGNTVEIRDLAVGEVWIASGQSNMEFTANKLSREDYEELKKRDWSKVRMFNVPRIARIGGLDAIPGRWRTPDAGDLGQNSAVALYFAHELASKLNVQVGVIHSSWGGTIAEAWTSREFLMNNPEMAGENLTTEESLTEKSAWEGYNGDSTECPWLEELIRKYDAEVNHGEANGYHLPECDRSDWKSMKLPARWNQAGEPFNGVLWFVREVEVPADWAGKELKLGVGAVDKHDITYFNGVEVGRTGKNMQMDYWDLPRFYPVPGELVKPGKNLIAVRAYSFLFDGGLIGPALEMYLKVPGQNRQIDLDGEWLYKVECNLGRTQDFARPSPGDPNVPHILYDNMIAPLIPYAIRGAIYYQGESNADDNFSGVRSYRRLMEHLVGCWRLMWGQGDFPFYQVLLANYQTPSPYNPAETWPKLREAQLQAAKAIGCPCASAIDAGDVADIHPKDKRTVGLRLAQLALSRDYGFGIEAQGPAVREIIVSGGAITVKFDHAAGGLELTAGASLFYIANADMTEFCPAQVELGRDFVRLTAERIPHPVFVRYAWADNPTGAMLYNSCGLPADPFRNDNQ